MIYKDSIPAIYGKLTDFWRSLPGADDGDPAQRYLGYTKAACKDTKSLFHPYDQVRNTSPEGIFRDNGWPNVPQHFKGDPNRARIITVLMNPGYDALLQSIPSDLARTADDVRRDIRLAEQANILQSQQDKDVFWWNWFGRHRIKFNAETICKDAGLPLEYATPLKRDELYFELEIIPYQSHRFADALRRAGGIDKLCSSQLSFSMLYALMRHTVETSCNRIFILRGRDLRAHLADQQEFKPLLKYLDSKASLFTFRHHQHRSVTPANLIPFDPTTGNVFQPQALDGRKVFADMSGLCSLLDSLPNADESR